jgi:phage head maturation protease
MTTRPPLEIRDSAVVTGVDFTQRIVEMVAVPYDESAVVEYRGELWDESFAPGSFEGIENRKEPNLVRVNRDHDHTRTVGKVIRFDTASQEGLVGEVRIAKTTLGDETLALADEDMLSLSAGFGVRGRDQVLDRSVRDGLPRRRILRAFMDHLAFVEQPAYVGARVLAVRSGEAPTAADLEPLVTPNLDEVLDWLKSRS